MTPTCNHSEVVAREILDALQRKFGAKIKLPWSAKKISNVSEGLGVWTTAKRKLSAVLLFRKIIVEERIRPWAGLATVCDSVFEGSLRVPVSPEEAFETLCEQLGAFRDHPDGSINGKEGGAAEDDQALAMVLCTGVADEVKTANPHMLE